MKILVLVLLLPSFVFLIVGVVKSINALRHFSQSGRSSSDNYIRHNNNPISNRNKSYQDVRRRQDLFKRIGMFLFVLKFVFLLLAFCLIVPFLLLISPFFFLIVAPIFFLRMPTWSVAFEKVKQEIDKYLNTAIPEIVSDWNYQELVRRASPDFLKYVEKKELQTIFDLCAKTLGKLTCYQVSKEGFKSGGGINSPTTTNWWEFFTTKSEPTMKQWEAILANYQTVAIFEKGMANIEIQVVKKHGPYLINSMNINIGSKSSQQSFRLGIATTLAALKNPKKFQTSFERS